MVGIDEIMTEPVDGSGYNPDYGLLGSNLASDDRVKLFPRDCGTLVTDIQARIFERTGKKLEVMVYGDGAFKDPAGGIWELADPVVSPGFTLSLIHIYPEDGWYRCNGCCGNLPHTAPRRPSRRPLIPL